MACRAALKPSSKSIIAIVLEIPTEASWTLAMRFNMLPRFSEETVSLDCIARPSVIMSVRDFVSTAIRLRLLLFHNQSRLRCAQTELAPVCSHLFEKLSTIV